MIKKQKNQDLVESFSGIRGIYGQSINRELAYKYARAYCQLFRKKISSLVIANDSRSSAPVLKKAMIRAFKDCGIKKIIDFGIVPIQVCEHGIVKFKASGGVYITASHNEPEYNGWKFLKEDGALLYPDQVDQLIKKACKVERKKSIIKELKKTKTINKNKEAIDEYINFILKRINKKEIDKIKNYKFRILFDPNGGSAIKTLEKLFKKLGVYFKIINNKSGQFKRLIEPNVKSLAYLSRQVDRGKFEFGCGFDCDADRVEFLVPSSSKFSREMGQMVSGQYALALSCDAYLVGTKNQIIVTNDCISFLLRDIIKKYQARVKEVEVGEMVVVKEMERQKSIIGGEGSCGGIIIPPIKCRDGIMTVVLFLKMISQRDKSLVDILEDYPKYYSERIKVKCSSVQVVETKRKLEKYFRSSGYEIKKTGDSTGGLKMLVDRNSYIWFRQSRTEPNVFRIITDGDSEKKAKENLKKSIKLFNRFKKDLNYFN